MGEFRLPDSFHDLSLVEGQLREELSCREAEYQLVQRNLPPNLNVKKTPAFYAMLVAHRKWQFAYEKLLVSRGKRVKA